ncbi:MAG: hypothetical protein JWM68_1765 [Verrucomicrobiales bacterium]|nr:hypothetical protein [Verrucomicrobiales bacterium]
MKMRALPIVVLLLSFVVGYGQPTAFTYQGKLNENGNPANGLYEFQFTLYDVLAGPGSYTSGSVTNAGVTVTNGLFTTSVDFGADTNAFPQQGSRYLEIGVRTNASVGTFTILSTRQRITSTPYAIVAGTVSATGVIGSFSTLGASTVNATTVTATSISGSLNATNLSGTIPDGRLSASVALVNANQTFSGSNTFTGSIVVPAPTTGSNAATRAYVDSAVASTVGVTTANYIYAYDTTVQSVIIGGTYQDITMSGIGLINGWTHGIGTATFTCNQTGVYLVEYTAEVQNAANGTVVHSTRALVNGGVFFGSEATCSLTVVTVPMALSKSFLVALAANDVVKFQYTANPRFGQLTSVAGQSFSCTMVRIQ